MAPSGVSSRVRTTTSSTWASVIVRGTPGRGSSPSPSSRRARNRARHLVTVTRLTRSRAATAVLLRPSAQASTIRARSASPCAVFRRFAQFSNVRRSASDSTSGSSLVSPMPPADRGPKVSSPPGRVLRRNTTHVVLRELKTGTLGHLRVFRRWPATMKAWPGGTSRSLFTITAMPFTSSLLGGYGHNPLAVDIFALNVLLAALATQATLVFGQRRDVLTGPADATEDRVPLGSDSRDRPRRVRRPGAGEHQRRQVLLPFLIARSGTLAGWMLSALTGQRAGDRRIGAGPFTADDRPSRHWRACFLPRRTSCGIGAYSLSPAGERSA